eukprot:62949-Prymnesium_polylepis.1
MRAFDVGVDIWARGDFGRASAISVDHRFNVQRGAVPPGAAYLAAPLLIKIAALAPANFGHFLGNAMFPAFEAAWRIFGARSLRMRYQLLLAGPNQSDTSGKMAARCLEWVNREASGGTLGARGGRADAPGRAGVRRRQQPRGGAGHVAEPRGGGHFAVEGRRLQRRHGRGGGALARAPRGGGASADGRHAPALDVAARERCAQHARAVSRFATQLLPGLSDFPLLWEGSLARAKDAAGGGGGARRWLCARRLIVGTGDFGFSTVHRLFNGTRRRPPK